MRYLSAKLILTALTVASTMFASSASAFDPDDLQKLKDTGDCEFKCNLTNANLKRADLEGADLEGANLSSAFLKNAYLAYANLKDVNLSGANLKDAKLGGAIMNGAILCNTTMPDGSVIYSGC
jgi:uncharacterized protein YjbI with pentapeptide repeats